jgi:hypothetical protein
VLDQRVAFARLRGGAAAPVAGPGDGSAAGVAG